MNCIYVVLYLLCKYRNQFTVAYDDCSSLNMMSTMSWNVVSLSGFASVIKNVIKGNGKNKNKGPHIKEASWW